MSSKTPFVRQVAWISLIPQLLFIAILTMLYKTFIRSLYDALNAAMITYVFAAIFLRYLIPRNHRKGIRFFKSNKYVQAISEFEKSYDFFTKHAWIDKYRFIVLLSSSRISYTEMALINTAFCYTQIGNGSKAKMYYKKALKQFPNSGMAKSALQMLNSATDSVSEETGTRCD